MSDRRLLPIPRRLLNSDGHLRGRPGAWCIAGDPASHAARVLAERFEAPVVPAAPESAATISLRVETDAGFARDLGPDQRPEAYSLTVGDSGVHIVATQAEGLLRGAATLLQLVGEHDGGFDLPCVEIADFPAFRFRCAADWLINVECNRWAYDWGDGLDATRARMERKLDLCFAHKINQVWFDGFGWDVNRTPHYAELARHLSGYARARGIRLTFAGYGAGYGTSYQQSEIYRAGYQGEVFVNRRPYPEGPEYLCCGLPEAPASRRYGTCPSNDAMQEAKLAEMARFVETVQPGFMYIHDIDTGHFSESEKAWQQRCDECRRRWPSDRLADPHGQAGAMAAWFRKIRDRLSALPADGDYAPAHDLTLIFTSPVYTTRHEPGQPEVWSREVEYFRVLSSLIGPCRGVQFGLREQLLQPSGEPRVQQLRDALDEAGCGHGVHVISFAGGDNYNTDDLTNVSGALAHLFSGAESVCLSNGGLHEEPVQLMNAEFLWNGSASRWAEHPRTATEAAALFDAMTRGEHRPAAIFGPDGLLHEACLRLWGEDAGPHMHRAHLSGDGRHWPVARVWWTVTREMRRLKGDPVGHDWTWESLREDWRLRLKVTREALGHARAAQQIREDTDIRWFARCLDVGERFAEVLVDCMALKIEDHAALRNELAARLNQLQAYLESEFTFDRTDVLGGDPGCWLETVDLLRKVMLGG